MTAITKERDTMEHARQNAKGWFESIEEMLAKLNEAQAADDQSAMDDARREIEESILSVMVRDAWRQPFHSNDDGPDEYEVLLSTGGPALRIWGKLDRYNGPESAELQMQDWGTPWTRYPAPEATLLSFVSNFQFG